MERGVYFDAWFPRQHCYHPSLPPRRLKMIDDLETYHATSLVWSALGGGSISLPYLEEEAWGEVDPRFRFYGFLNDAEFIQHCQERGIKVFGIVFEVQGWEFPVELNEDESEVLSMNELRGVGKRGWLGLREFTQNSYPKLWKPLEHYFPDGLVNSDGERVTDILEECTSRDIYGEACHSTWVEVPGNGHYAYLMDRNNPVWREYLKAIIRIQIDAGVAGVELDEADLPIFATGYGGCFCKDCMKLFKAYLQQLPADEVPEELKDTDLEIFHYGSWLLERGYDFKSNRETTPLYWTYIRFQRKTIVGYFAELADYVKEYGRSKGRDVLVSGNYYYLSPHYYPFEPKADILVTEMNATSYRQPAWCRYAAGFARGKPVIVVENPYGGVGPELLPKLQNGKAYDLFRMMQYEASALGINMSVPYGAWMGSVIEDSFWAPHEVNVEIQDFITEHERLYTTETFSEVVVAFSIQSAYDWEEQKGWKIKFPFWTAVEGLVGQHQPFDVVVLPEGTLREDWITSEDLTRYRTLVLPECTVLTRAQVASIRGYLEHGGHVLATGELGRNMDPSERASLLGHPHLVRTTEVRSQDFAGGPQVFVEPAIDLAVNIHRVSDKEAAIHVIRYDYDEERDEVPILDRMHIDVRLARPFRSLKVFSPTSEVGARLTFSREVREMHRIELENVSLYTVILLQ
ncbi:MAG TPA: hypothetical protein VGR41_01920 [Actinomycetota bacterium]|jgi:hypothetical protein|nr:hypothetical protein [Actinomycetota bacterium]